MNWLQYKFGLWSLRWQKRREFKRISEMVETAKKANGPDAQSLAGLDVLDAVDHFNDELAALQTRRIRTLAEKFLIPISDEIRKSDGAWEESRVRPGHYRLTIATINEVRRAIHDERKRRQEVWLPWAAGITGLIGAATGLAAVLLR